MKQNRDQYLYGQPIFYKGTKTIQWREGNLFNKLYWDNGLVICQKKSKISIHISHQSQQLI